jgi:hypothetical protein
MEETPEYINSYQTGFNEGYLIAKHEPDLSEKLSKIKVETPRIDGIHDGRREFILEQIKERNTSRNVKEKSPDKNKDRDKGGYQPDK